MFELMQSLQSILEARMAVKPEEQVLIISDNEGGSMWLGQIFMEVANSMGAVAVLSIIPSPDADVPEPPTSVAAAMKCANAIFRISDRASLGHTNARKEASDAGARFYIVYPSLVDELKQGLSAADIDLVKKQTESLAQRVRQANVAKVTNPSGTDITMTVTGRRVQAIHPMSRAPFVLHHYAEVAVAPVEGTAEGVMVADLGICQWGYPFREPIRYTVKAGKVVDIAGPKREADRLRKIFATNENAGNIAELGIGTCHIDPLAMLGTKRDAARLGTVHIAIGRNNDIGGTTWSPVHLDNLIGLVTVELDGQCVLRDGTLLI